MKGNTGVILLVLVAVAALGSKGKKKSASGAESTGPKSSGALKLARDQYQRERAKRATGVIAGYTGDQESAAALFDLQTQMEGKVPLIKYVTDPAGAAFDVAGSLGFS